MKERDKRPTEAMGLCSHDYKAYGQHSHQCSKCLQVISDRPESADLNPDFSTWEGFGKLVEYLTSKDLWHDFIVFCIQVKRIYAIFHFVEIIKKPSSFADAADQFLREREKERVSETGPTRYNRNP